MFETNSDTSINEQENLENKIKKRKQKSICTESEENTNIEESEDVKHKLKKSKKHKKEEYIEKDTGIPDTDVGDDEEKCVRKLKKKKRKENTELLEELNKPSKKKNKSSVVNDDPNSDNDEPTSLDASCLFSNDKPEKSTSLLRPDYIYKNSSNKASQEKLLEKIQKDNSSNQKSNNDTSTATGNGSDTFCISNLWQKQDKKDDDGSNKPWQNSKGYSVNKRENSCSENYDFNSRAKKNSNFNNFETEDNEFSYEKEKKNKWQRKDYSYANELLCTPNTRQYTVSIAVPASILQQTCPLDKFKTYVVGQVSRAASIYCVDEIIVYNDNCWRNSTEEFEEYLKFMKVILEYQECPQYMKKRLFPMHPYLKDSGVLSVLNAPHHLLASEWCKYREGIVLDKCVGKNSCVDVGLGSDVDIDRKLDPGLRVTIKFPDVAKTMRKLYGEVVSPEEPRTTGGLYWGYTVRIASSLNEVTKSERFEDGYDLIIGTSDKGDPLETEEFPTFRHALVLFGGVEGLEAAMKTDPEVTEEDPKKYFQKYLNTCADQGSKTIRTEEAVLITLCQMSSKFKKYGNQELCK